MHPEVPLDSYQFPFLAARAGIALMERLNHKYLPYCDGWADKKDSFSFHSLLRMASLELRGGNQKPSHPLEVTRFLGKTSITPPGLGGFYNSLMAQASLVVNLRSGLRRENVGEGIK